MTRAKLRRWGGYTIGAIAALLAGASLVVGVWFPRPPRIPPPPWLGTTSLEAAGCAYLRDIGAVHNMPVTACTLISETRIGPEATAQFRIVQVGQTYTLHVHFIRSPWQVVSATD